MEKGVIIRIITGNPDKLYKYIYPDNLNMDHKEAKKWFKTMKKKLKKEDPNYKSYKFVEPLYWKLTYYSCIRIYKDNNWIQRNIPTFYQFWNKILYYRENKNEYNELIKTFEENRKQRDSYDYHKPLANYLLGDSDDD